jgi:hypothetical protein
MEWHGTKPNPRVRVRQCIRMLDFSLRGGVRGEGPSCYFSLCLTYL